jgi:DNA invertase Pin-like site-specific DNA recombinase
MRVGIYCRLSEEDRDKQSPDQDSRSIENQKAMLLRHALKQGWDVHDIYNDDDYKGADRKRPEFNRILEDAQKKKIDIILCKSQSRFTREMEFVEKYLHGLFPIWGIRFVSIVDNADTDNKGNKKARQINGLTNEWYLEDMSDNIKSALTIRRVQGFHIGAFALYGYMKDPGLKGHLVIDEEAAAVVRKVFNLYAEGYGRTAIARILNAEGIPNPTEYKRLKGIRKKTSQNQNAKLWKYYAISDMLTNEIYIGHMVQGKYGSISYKTGQNKPKPKDEWIKVENTHEPIIEAELWERVQNKVAQNYKPFSVDGKVGLFAKKVRCMDCGYYMRSSKTRDDYYIKCTTNHASKDACVGAFISVKLLESVVIKELNDLFLQYLDVDYIEQRVDLKDNREIKLEQLQKDLEAYEKKREEYSNGIKTLYADKLKGIITEEDFVELSKDFQDNRNNLDKLIEEKRKALEKLNSRKTDLLSKRQKIEKYTHLTNLTRDVVEELIDYISVGKKDSETGERQIEIYWNF